MRTAWDEISKDRYFAAAILTAINAPLVVDRISAPERLWQGQVLVRMLVSGICGAQLQEIRGEKGNVDYMPHLIGHEGAGIVEAVGPGVTRVKAGDKVCCHWRKGAGIDAPPPSYGWENGTPKLVGAGQITTLCEKAVISENRLTPVPADTPDDLCALLGCGLSTALGTIESEARVKFGESVLIVGAGGLGANLIRCACMANAHPIVAMDINEHKAPMAYELGADLYVNVKSENWRKVLKAAGTERFDVVIDTSGDGIEDALPLLAPSGRFIMIGQPKPGRSVEMKCAAHMFEGEGKLLKATQGGGFRPSVDIPRYVNLWRAGLLKIDGIITKRFSLAHVNEALDLVRAGQASRVLIDMSL